MAQLAGPKGFRPGYSAAYVLAKALDLRSTSAYPRVNRLTAEGRIAPYPPGARTYKAGYLIVGKELQEDSIQDTRISQLESIMGRIGALAATGLNKTRELQEEFQEIVTDLEQIRGEITRSLTQETTTTD